MTTAPDAPLAAEQTLERPGGPTNPQTRSGGSPETHHEASQPLAYVVMTGTTPTAAAPTLQLACDAALTAEQQYRLATERQYRWDEHSPGVWRLMSRVKGPAGSARRYSWTTRAVHAVDLLAGGEDR